MNENLNINRPPLSKNKFAKLPLTSVKPKGWLLHQLELQADGFTGHIEEEWEDVGKNNGWLGGSAESWERGPYYCDGLIPLAYLTGDPSLMEKSMKWVEWALHSQNEDGFFGPKGNRDWWPRMIMIKALIQYYEVTEDERVITFLRKFFNYQLKNLENDPLMMWGKMRGAENLLEIYWLYNLTGDRFLLECAGKVRSQAFEWNNFFKEFPYRESTSNYLDFQYFMKYAWDDILNPTELSKAEAEKLFKTFHTSHVVNVAMGIKAPLMDYVLTGDKKYFDSARESIYQVMKYHGTANGMFTGDEHLSGLSPSQGTELCAVVEYMFSLENIICITGDGSYGDILEGLAFNALPATLSPDLRSHQYVQQANQVICNVAERKWYNNEEDSNIFGLEPNFGCCTANMHQGWPKFCQNLWLKDVDGGLVCISYAPCEVSYKTESGEMIILSVDTNYPFEENVTIKISADSPQKLDIRFRIPEWCSMPEARINGEELSIEAKSFFCVDRIWNDRDIIEIKLPMKISIKKYYRNSISVERGPLIYSLGLGEQWNVIERRKWLSDYEVLPTTDWNYGLDIDFKDVEGSFEVVKYDMEYQPFELTNAPVKLICKAKKIPEWTLEYNSAGEPPFSPVFSSEAEENIELVPYGSARLRITQFPYIAR
ncbi:MAG TPA: beta-L-arabinofuranosidase domain-containing protein [Clostridia bacterium]|nr:beta-L-arabinofuranosidase domain-containing protein [Clostridia bacterium]